MIADQKKKRTEIFGPLRLDMGWQNHPFFIASRVLCDAISIACQASGTDSDAPLVSLCGRSPCIGPQIFQVASALFSGSDKAGDHVEQVNLCSVLRAHGFLKVR